MLVLRSLCVGFLVAWQLLSQTAQGREPLVLVSGRVSPTTQQSPLREAVELYRARIDAGKLPNAILIVLQRQRLVVAEALGWRDKDAGEAMQLDTLLRMASNTKAVVATGVLILQERGLLSIEDPLGKYLPEFDNALNGEVTIKQLLSHTSGWRIKPLFLAPLEEASAQFPNRPNLVSEVNRFANIRPKVPPGTSYSYNNAGYNTIGALIEVVSGQTLEEFLTVNIYQPLEMDDSSNHPPADRLEEMSYVYGLVDGQWQVRFAQEGRMRVPFVRASGGMVSTAEDYARFCHMYLLGGKYRGVRVLSRRSVRQATEPVTESLYSADELAKRTKFYGLGWSVGKDGSFSHSGSEGTYVWIDPHRKVVGMVLTQSSGFDNPREEFRRQVTAALDAGR